MSNKKFDESEVAVVKYEKSKIDRQYLEITLKTDPNTSDNPELKDEVLVIMKNPSETCKEAHNGEGILMPTPTTDTSASTSNPTIGNCAVDDTTDKVINYLKGKCKKIIVLNLYSYYDADAKNVDAYYYGISCNLPAIFATNCVRINEVLKTYKGDVICAWGEDSGIRQPNYDDHVKWIDSILENNPNFNVHEYDSEKAKKHAKKKGFSPTTVPFTKLFKKRDFKDLYPTHPYRWGLEKKES